MIVANLRNSDEEREEEARRSETGKPKMLKWKHSNKDRVYDMSTPNRVPVCRPFIYEHTSVICMNRNELSHKKNFYVNLIRVQ